MSANISVVNGVAEMFSGNNEVPWHGLGTVVAGLLKAEDAIKAAHLDWTVKAMQVICNGRVLPFPDKTQTAKTARSEKEGWQGIVREDTGDVLGIMRGRYEIIQNKDCFNFMDVLAGQGNLTYESAGALRGGRQVWLLAKYDGDVEIAKDKHNQWLLLVTSHDGSYSLMGCWTTVRVVCNNTLTAALNKAYADGKNKKVPNMFKVRHTRTWEDKAAEAKRILGLTGDYFTNMREILGSLNEKPMTSEDAEAFTKMLFPAKDEKEVSTRTSNMRWGVQRLFREGAGNHGNSRWDMLNAVTDYADHQMVVRGKNSTRLESALLGTGAELKQRAVEYLTSDKLMAELLSKPVQAVLDSGAEIGKSEFARLLGN